MASMQTSDVTQDQLQRLATFAAPEGFRVLSLYLNLDPSGGTNLGTGAGRRTAVTSLLDEAERRVEGEEELSHDAHMALRADASRAREELEGGEVDGWAEGAAALALFLCGPGELFEMLRLPRTVDSRVVIADRPAVEPLAEAGPAESWAVLLVDGQHARLLEGTGDRLEDVADHTDDTSSISGKGGWSAQRYERSVGKDIHDHMRNAVDLLVEHFRERDYKHILVGATEPNYAELKDLFPPEIAERVIGHFPAEVEYAKPQDIREKVEPLLQAHETHLEKEAIDRAWASGVRGLTDTLPALYERRVAALLLEPGLERPGVVCPRCRWAAAEERGACPVDGETMVEHPNLAEWAVELAIEQSAEVVSMRHHDDLSDHDGIAAALRF